MVLEGTSVGLDVHARSIVAGVLDAETGEVRSQRLPAATEAVVGWIGSLPGPVVVAYEAGPTGFGLARHCHQLGCGGWWWPRPSWNTRQGIGSRPTGGTRNGWQGWPTSGSCPRCGCQARPRSRAGPGPRPGGRPRGSDGGAASAVEAAAMPWAGRRRRRLDPGAPAVAAWTAVRPGELGCRLRRGRRRGAWRAGPPGPAGPGDGRAGGDLAVGAAGRPAGRPARGRGADRAGTGGGGR
jgi:hypothetical protein